MDVKPESAVAMARISEARDGVTAGVDDQIRDLRAHAKRIGWRIGKEVVENDVSAFKRRRVTLPDGRVVMRVWRPAYREALADLQAGRHDGLLVVDLDRTTRDPRDLEDLIDVVESRHPRIPVESISGSLKLANDADITMSRIMGNIANKASRDAARRLRRARLRQAEEGRYGGGIRRYGHVADGLTLVPEEAEVIRWAADQILSGVSMRMLAADLRARGVPTPTGRAQWSPQALRGILTRPSTAGLVVHQGAVMEGVAAVWAPILDRATWDAVRGILTSPDRPQAPGNTPKWLGSGLYLCGHPDCLEVSPRPALVVQQSNGLPAYRCARVAHLARKALPLDDHIERAVIGLLGRPDILSLATVRPDVDTAALSRRAAMLRAQIREAGDLWEEGVIDADELRARRSRLKERLAAVQAEMASAAGVDALAGLAGPDPGVLWDDLSLGRQRAVLDALVVVEVLPVARLGRPKTGDGIDPDRVRITPRAQWPR